MMNYEIRLWFKHGKMQVYRTGAYTTVSGWLEFKAQDGRIIVVPAHLLKRPAVILEIDAAK